jgi:3-oxoadipate enol-lactonase
MPSLQLSGARLHVEDTGGPGPAAVFSHGLLWSTSMWRFQVEAFRASYRCIAWDHRGQGKSEVTAAGYDMDTLARDAAELIEKLAAAPVHFVGLSMGGFVGMRLAARRPELVRTLALIETAADREPLLNIPRYKAMTAATRLFGVGLFAPAVMKIMFAKPFLQDPARARLRAELEDELRGNDPAGLRRAVDGVIFRKPVAVEELNRIRCPTAVISGELDSAVVPARSRALQQHIPGSRFVTIPRAGHSSSLEEPQAINAALRALWEA